MKKNDYYIGECIDYTHDGLGVVKIEGFAVFVKNMLIGEVGNIKIIKVLKSYAVGRLIKLSITSKDRNEPRCPVYKQCGGCNIQHLNNKAQQVFKTNRVKETLKRIGDCDVEVNDCLMQENPWFYRNKVQVPVGKVNNNTVIGFYKNHSNDIISFDKCYIQNEQSNEIIQRVKELLIEFNIEPYNKITKTGNIKHILTKTGFYTNQIMVVLISKNKKINHIYRLVNILKKEYSNITTIIQNINPREDNVILGEKEIVLYGNGYIEDYLLGLKYQISLKSFYQVNPKQVEVLYNKAIEFASFNEDDVVLDAYCGIGTIGMSLASKVKKVIGVEIVPQAIKDAKNNALINNIDNIEFIAQDAGEFMVDFKNKKQKIDVVMLDPPRKGCSKLFLDQLVELSPNKIVYISCNVATQARDIDYLQKANYKAIKCQPVDMFPQTSHVETVVLMSRVER